MSRRAKTWAGLGAVLATLLAAWWLWAPAARVNAAPPAPPGEPARDLRAEARPGRSLDPARPAPAVGPPDDGGDADGGRAEGEARAAAWLRRNAEDADRRIEQFCAENRALAEAKVLPDLPRTRDAASYLGVRVDWVGRVGTLHLAQPLVDRLASLPADGWLRLPPDAWAGLDFGWMTELLAYDFWSISRDGPVRDEDEVAFDGAPLPDFRSLSWWSQLRLARGLREGELARASAEVRHLASIVASTDLWVGGLEAEELLRLDRTAWQRSGLPPPTEEVATEAQLARFRRVANAAPNFFWPGVAPAVRDRALACLSTARCASMAEALTLQVAVRDVVGAAGISWLAAQPGCDRGFTERTLQARPLPIGAQSTFFGPNFGIAVSLDLDGGRWP